MEAFEEYYNRLMTENQYVRSSGRFNHGQHTTDTKELLNQTQAMIDQMGERTPEEVKAEVEALNAKIQALYGAAQDQVTDNPGQYNSKQALASGMTNVNKAYDQYQQTATVNDAVQYVNTVRDVLMG